MQRLWTSPAWILTLATLAVCLALKFLFDNKGPGITSAIFVGSSFSLSTFSACWFCLSRKLIRFPLVVGALSLIGFLLKTESSGSAEEWLLFALPFAIALPVVTTVEIAKSFLGTFTLIDLEKQEDFKEGMQFSIRHLIFVTTLTAICMAFWKAFGATPRIHPTTPSSSEFFLIIALIGGTIALFTLLSIWTLLGNTIRSYRTMISMLIGSTAIAATSTYGPPHARLFWVGMFVICWVALIALLWLLRLEGYRFIKHGHPN